VRKEYIVQKVGSGTMEDPFRPGLAEIDVSEGAIVQLLEDLGNKVKVEVIHYKAHKRTE